MTRLAGRLAGAAMIAALLTGAVQPAGNARAASGTVLFHLDGASTRYADRGAGGAVSGAPRIAQFGRAFGARIGTSVRAKAVSRLGNRFPYGVYGLNEKDGGTSGVYTDRYDADPLVLADAIRREGVYNIAVSTQLGAPTNTAKIVRNLKGVQARGIKLILRALQFKGGSGADRYEVDVARTRSYLAAYRKVFRDNPGLESVIYAWYSYDEPFAKQPSVDLVELRRAYGLYKEYFPNTPVFTVYNQSPNPANGDANRDGIYDGFFGQPKNPYGSGVADIVGLDAYVAVNELQMYTYHAIELYYETARRAVNRVNANTPIWAIAQAHGLTTSPANLPEPHQMVRQANDWLRAGPDNGLRGIDGLIWYSWHFQNDSPQSRSDLEDNAPQREMARTVGTQARAGSIVTHRKPYRNELFVPAAPAAAVRVPRSGHLSSGAGTITFAFSHQWQGNDGRAHVLFDTGASATRDRLTIEKTAGNILRLRVMDPSGGQKWTGLKVGLANMPGNVNQPGYSDIAAVWSNGSLALYLDGVRGTLGGGTGSGRLSSPGSSFNIGHDLAVRNGANGSYSYLTIRSAAGTQQEVRSWGSHAHTLSAPGRPALASPANGASTTDATPRLAWSGAGRAVRYQVQLSTSSSFASPVQSATVTGAAYTARALTRGRTYYWRVAAADSYGMGTYSAPRSFVVR